MMDSHPHIKGRMNPSLGLVAAIPGGKHPCYGDCEPIWEQAEELISVDTAGRYRTSR